MSARLGWLVPTASLHVHHKAQLRHAHRMLAPPPHLQPHTFSTTLHAGHCIVTVMAFSSIQRALDEDVETEHIPEQSTRMSGASGCAIDDPAREMPHCVRPCANCPWRRDSPAHEFPIERYAALRATSGHPGLEAGLGAPAFACHKSHPGRDRACAGWLAVAGIDHLGVRLAVAIGRLQPTVLQPGEDWPELFASFDEMAERNGLISSTETTRPFQTIREL